MSNRQTIEAKAFLLAENKFRRSINFDEMELFNSRKDAEQVGRCIYKKSGFTIIPVDMSWNTNEVCTHQGNRQ